MFPTFKEYQSKPIIRRAYQIQEGDGLDYWAERSRGLLVTADDSAGVDFAAYQEPVVGDFIVYLNDDDIYHCSADVFRERNIVD